MQGFYQALLVVGTHRELAKRIGVSIAAPGNWVLRGRVPAEHCPAIERETGVRCEVIRPDIPWGVLRAQPASRKAKSV
ncbi:MAG: helix-turn-helix domain-containing protein [Proteobacteria bacterium]|nr:helix-turn-helix domain-containing protein [Pseudomonadota bacterium]